MLETTDISISGRNRRREEIRTFIVTTGAAVNFLKSVEGPVSGSQLLGMDQAVVLGLEVCALIPSQCSHQRTRTAK